MCVCGKRILRCSSTSLSSIVPVYTCMSVDEGTPSQPSTVCPVLDNYRPPTLHGQHGECEQLCL